MRKIIQVKSNFVGAEAGGGPILRNCSAGNGANLNCLAPVASFADHWRS